MCVVCVQTDQCVPLRPTRGAHALTHFRWRHTTSNIIHLWRVSSARQPDVAYCTLLYVLYILVSLMFTSFFSAPDGHFYRHSSELERKADVRIIWSSFLYETLFNYIISNLSNIRHTQFCNNVLRDHFLLAHTTSPCTHMVICLFFGVCANFVERWIMTYLWYTLN